MRSGTRFRARLENEVFTTDDGAPLTQGAMLGIVNRAAEANDTIVAAAGALRRSPADVDCTGGKNAHIESAIVHGLRDPARWE